MAVASAAPMGWQTAAESDARWLARASDEQSAAGRRMGELLRWVRVKARGSAEPRGAETSTEEETAVAMARLWELQLGSMWERA